MNVFKNALLVTTWILLLLFMLSSSLVALPVRCLSNAKGLAETPINGRSIDFLTRQFDRSIGTQNSTNQTSSWSGKRYSTNILVKVQVFPTLKYCQSSSWARRSKSMQSYSCSTAAKSLNPLPLHRDYATSSKSHELDHHHHEQEPKKATPTLQPHPKFIHLDDCNKEREIKEIEGILFGSKVVYIDPLVPYDYTNDKSNGWLFNKPPRKAGQPYVWKDWEPISYGFTILIALIGIVYWWAKPPSSIQLWAAEEARERQIIAARAKSSTQKDLEL